MDVYQPLEDTLDHLRSMGLEVNENDYLYSRRKLFYLLLRINFIIFDVILSILSFMVYIWASSDNRYGMNMFEMSQYCDDPDYNHRTYTVSNAGEYFAYWLMVAVFISVWFTTYAESVRGWRVMMFKIVQRTWITSIGYCFLCICVFVLQTLFGHPVPYFFSNPNLYEFYCGTSDVYFVDFFSLVNDKYAKTSPSYFVALEWYSSAFLVFYIDRCDLGLGPHATRFAIGIFCGLKCMLDGVTLYENHEIYFSDIACAAITAIAFAAFTAGNVNGPVVKNVIALPIYITNGILFDTMITASRSRTIPSSINLC